MSENCECTKAGYCQRHKREKTEDERRLCETSAHYRALWDRQAKSGERGVCSEWDELGENSFRCRRCNRTYETGVGAPPENRPCVPPRGAAPPIPLNCSDWERLEGGTFRCPRCGQSAAAHSFESLPKSRPCIVPRQTATGTQAAKQPCSGCGGGAPSVPKQSEKQEAPEVPSLGERAKNLLGAAKDFIKEPGFVAHDEAADRLKVCDSCIRVSGHFCSVCGCWLATASKIKSKHCPMGKWPGDDKNWSPLVHDNWLKQTLAVVIHYGDASMTQACVKDCFREPVRVVVIDNSGNYQAIGKEKVVRPGSNIGWGAACNWAIGFAIRDESIQGVVLLNNDLRLSPGFFSGLIVAQQVMRAGIVSACYNVGWNGQKPSNGYSGTAGEYQPKPTHRLSGYCDGTAVLLGREVLNACGELDQAVSPVFGWGLLMDYSLRAREAGFPVTITEAAYVYHQGMQAAVKVHGSVAKYLTGAKTESQYGLTKKWGDDYQQRMESTKVKRAIKTLNLIYHIWPVATNNRWQWNVKQLLKRIHIFNGKKVVAIATGEKSAPTEEVEEMFAGYDVTFIEKPNSPVYREANTFLELLDAVKTDDPTEATFYAHCKGVSRADNEAELHWASLMYDELLDDTERVKESLSEKGMLGVSFEFNTPWIFPGTFWWFHNASLFAKPLWRVLENPITTEGVGWSVEAFPNRFFSDDCERIYPNLYYPTKRAVLLYNKQFWEQQATGGGASEREMLAKAVAEFDEPAYIARYQDVAKDVGLGIWSSGLEHYVSHGFWEGRQSK